MVLAKLQLANVFRGNDREFIPRNLAVRTACGSGPSIVRERNVLDPAARNQTAHGHAMQHSGETQIIDVEGLAGDFLPAFFAGDWFADEVHDLGMVREPCQKFQKPRRELAFISSIV